MGWLRRHVTTVDVFIGLLVLAAVVYFLIRWYGWPFSD
jgi:hypothetical protein